MGCLEGPWEAGSLWGSGQGHGRGHMGGARRAGSGKGWVFLELL